MKVATRVLTIVVLLILATEVKMAVGTLIAKPELRHITGRYFEKTWITKADWESGILVNLIVPENTDRLELKRLNLRGTGTFIFDPGLDLTAKWVHFNAEYDTAPTKTILRDDFQEDSFSEYDLEIPTPGWSYGAPVYDSVNKRIKFDTTKGFTLRPKNFTIQNFVLSYDFYSDVERNAYVPFMAMGRWIDQSNMYNLFASIIQRDPEVVGSPRIDKWVGGSQTILKKEQNPLYQFGTEYHLIATFNGNSLRIQIPNNMPPDDVSVTDSSLPDAGGVKFGSGQGRGWIDHLLIEHLTLPDPPGCSQTVIFWTSNNGQDWDGPYNKIEDCSPSRFLKWQVTLARDSLDSAMPVVHDHTVGYFLKPS